MKDASADLVGACSSCREDASAAAANEAEGDASTASAWAQLVEGTKGPEFGNVASSSGDSMQHS